MAETSEKKEIFRIKETFSVDEVNKMMRQGWTLLSAKFQFGTILFKLVKE